MNDEHEEEIQTEEPVDDVTFVESTEDGDDLPPKDVAKKLRETLAICRKEKEEYLTGWQRAKADYVNLKKDEEEKRKDIKKYVVADFIEELLPVLDSYDMAFSNTAAWEKVDANWRKGVEYIHAQLLKVLSNHGVSEIAPLEGSAFDHNLHQSIETVATDDEARDNTVAKVTQKGYRNDSEVIRPARVNVYTKS